MLTRVALFMVVSLVPGALSAQGGMQMKMPTGKDVTVTGTVIDVSCKFGQGLSGDAHRMCAQICADNGLPLAILGDDGKLYIPTTADMPGKGQNDKLKAFAEQKVTIKGKAFAAAGATAIQIASVSGK
ncbi:MAG: hypothetical protein IPJ11_08725 [Gemmatimonadetes bacterium]|nr:hypothetical protein [Gemmatimonadota bacterium]